MIIKKNELKAKTSEYIEEMIAKAEDYVARRLVEASAEGVCRLHVVPPNDIPRWAMDEVAKRYREEGYVAECPYGSLWIVIDDEAYKKQKEEDSKRNWSWDL